MYSRLEGQRSVSSPPYVIELKEKKKDQWLVEVPTDFHVGYLY